MDRITELKNMLAAREKLGGYKQNCGAIRAEIARLEAGKPPKTTGQENDL